MALLPVGFLMEIKKLDPTAPAISNSGGGTCKARAWRSRFFVRSSGR